MLPAWWSMHYILQNGSYLEYRLRFSSVRQVSNSICSTFLCPRKRIRGYLVFVLSVCDSLTLWQENFNLGRNFWTFRDRDFIFGMNTHYSTNEILSNSTKVNDHVTLTATFIQKTANFGLCCHQGVFVFHKHTRFNLRKYWDSSLGTTSQLI